MRILIVAPVPPTSTRGNRITALRWQSLLQQLGCEVTIAESYQDDLPYDVLVALHARRSHAAIRRFRELQPQARVIVCLTGTDLHVDFQSANQHHRDATTRQNYRDVQDSLQRADLIVLLEPHGIAKLPARFRTQTRVILQSAEPAELAASPRNGEFLVTVIAHLRAIKDPFRTARAARQLPETSRIRVVQIGAALNPTMRLEAENEQRLNPRYQWIGPVPHAVAIGWLTQSQLTVLSSIHEGAPSVISEAVVNGIPVLASRIDACIGLLGSDYPGLFPVGDTQQLADLMSRAELDPAFLQQLNRAVRDRQYQFSRDRELQAWRDLLRELGLCESGLAP